MKQITFLFALLITGFSFAQTGSVSGKITDKDFNDEPLSFANVLVKGTTKGTSSDFDGLYSLENIEPGEIQLEFSFVGYETKVINVTIEANKNTVINAS